MSDVLVIGDTQQAHPQRAFLAALEEQYPSHAYWFLGDALDSYTSKPLEQVATLTRILELIEAGRAKCVWSNHDAGYAFPHLNGWCSGWNTTTAALVCAGPLAERMRKAFVPYIAECGVLVTHAGVSQSLLKYLTLDFSTGLLDEWFAERGSPFWWVGRARGGRNAIGGPLWCDWDDEFSPVPGLVQIVGHTHRRDGEIHCVGEDETAPEAYNVDCLGHRGSGEAEHVLSIAADGTIDRTDVIVTANGRGDD